MVIRPCAQGGADHEASAGVGCRYAIHGIDCERLRQEERCSGCRLRKSLRRLAAGHPSWVGNCRSLSLRGAGCLRERILRLRPLDRTAEDGVFLPIRRLSILTRPILTHRVHTPQTCDGEPCVSTKKPRRSGAVVFGYGKARRKRTAAAILCRRGASRRMRSMLFHALHSVPSCARRGETHRIRDARGNRPLRRALKGRRRISAHCTWAPAAGTLPGAQETGIASIENGPLPCRRHEPRSFAKRRRRQAF